MSRLPTRVPITARDTGLRLYRLIDLVLEEKLSRASWPAWNNVAMKLRSASEAMKQRALFQLPRVYRASVRFFVAAAVLTDTFVLGSASGRLLARAQDDPEWQRHVYFGAAVNLVLNAVLVWFVSVRACTTVTQSDC